MRAEEVVIIEVIGEGLVAKRKIKAFKLTDYSAMCSFDFTTGFRMEDSTTYVFYTLLHTPTSEDTGSSFDGIELTTIIGEDLEGFTILFCSFTQFREYISCLNRTSVEPCTYYESRVIIYYGQ